MGEVVSLDGTDVRGSGVSLDPNHVLESAKGDLSEVVVIGRDKDGKFHLAGSHGELETMWLIRMGERLLMDSAAPR